MSAWGANDVGTSEFSSGWNNGSAIATNGGAGDEWNATVASNGYTTNCNAGDWNAIAAASGYATNGNGGEWNGGGVGAQVGGNEFGGDTFGMENMNVNQENGNNDGGNMDDRACFNCGENGHQKADCTKPRVFQGACRRCNQEGHMSKDCPDAPALKCKNCDSPDHLIKDCPSRTCKNCGETGHTISKCENARKVDREAVPGMTTDEAWEKIKCAVKEREVDDVKEALQIYVKSAPETTYEDLERAFRSQDIPLWLIAIEKPLAAATLTNMDLQGNLGKKYTVTYRFQWNPPRPRDRELWPANVEENIERLKDAGEVVDRGLPQCRNCGELGHISKSCPQEKIERERVTIRCYNCDETGHRVRDCPIPRVDRFACRNCGKTGHQASDCPEPKSAADVECRRCGEMGHFANSCPSGGGNRCRNCDEEGHMARECPAPLNMAKIQCRNCDEYGHTSRDCAKPRDYSRIKCNNCGEMGHTMARCRAPPASGNDGDGGFGGDSVNGGFDNAGAAAGGGGWESAPVVDLSSDW